MSSESEAASTENMADENQLLNNKWYVREELMQGTPSVLRGMSVSEELERRRKGIRFIKYLMRYLTFEKIIQGDTLDQTKAPRVFPTAVHFFQRFYTIHPFQIFNEYVTAVTCVFHATKVEEHIMPIQRILELARINASSLSWVKIPEEMSFDKNDWAELWKNEVRDTEFLLFTTVNPLRFLFVNAYGFILMNLKKWSGVAIKEEEAVRIRDRAFSIVSDVYSCGSTIVVTEPPRMVASMCLMMVLKQHRITISKWSGKTDSQLYWYQLGDPTTTLEKLKKLEVTFLAHLKQYNLDKAMDEKHKEKGVSPSSDYGGSEGSVISNPVSPSDSMCSDRDAVSNGQNSPAASTASSSDHGVSFRDERRDMRRPVVVKNTDLAPPCQVSLSIKRNITSHHHHTSSSSSVNHQSRNAEMQDVSVEPVHKKLKKSVSPVRWC